ncbi:MAG: hydroxypyruvate isomerase [Pseudomonadota bacterium]
MPKLAANISMLFQELDFMDRIDAAAKAGFEAVECLFPYAYDADEIARRMAKCNLIMVLHNFPAGDWNKGDRGLACDPMRISEFEDSIDLAISFAKTLGVKQLNCLAGIRPAEVSPAVADQTIQKNLRYAAERLNKVGLRLLLEPINTYDIPGFSVSTSKYALELMKKVSAENILLQYDVYHMQRMEGELANTISQNLNKIAHIQIADTPGRTEPGTGEINYGFLLRLLDELGYTGWVGCEYLPENDTLSGLNWRSKISEANC